MTIENVLINPIPRKTIKGLRSRDIFKRSGKTQLFTTPFVVTQQYYKTKYYSSGQSDWSFDLADRLKELSVYMAQTFSAFELRDALNSLREIQEECSKSGWDGYDAFPIPKFAVNEAELFLNLLPPSIIIPHVSPDPRGGIALEWRNSRNDFIIITLKGNFILNYAGYFGANNKIHGTEPFINSIPRTILEKLSSYFRVSE